MAQHIGCIIQDENCKIVKDSNLNFAKLNGLLWENDPDRKIYPWLLTIDEYSDTTFNQLQIPYILSELSDLSSRVDDNWKSEITAFMNFIQSTVEPHLYLKFIGD